MVKKKTEIEAPVNAALQASITPVGIEFSMNKLRLGENYCRIYGIFMLPTEVEYGWLSKLTNIPGTIVTINYEPRNNAEAINDLSRKIRMFRGQAASTKDPKERMRCEKAALSQETALQRMDSGNESMGVWDITIMVLSRDEEDFNNRCTRVENTANVIGCKIRIMANQQKESYQHLSPTYPQISEIREENARQYLVGDIIGGFPFASGSFTDSGGFYLGRDSNDGLILLDPWIRNRQRPNSNMTIVGGSGSGKSTAIKHIIASEYARGTKIIVIDPEGEYKDMCLNPLFEGSWIDVAGGRGGLINPLQIRPVPPDVDDNSDPVKKDSIGDLAVHLKTLQTFFRLYIPSMDDRLRAILDQSLVELYFSFGITWETDVSGMNAERFPILSDLYSLISRKSHQRIYSAGYQIADTDVRNGAGGAVFQRAFVVLGADNPRPERAHNACG